MNDTAKIKRNVLVFPCGSEIGLEINRSLRFSKDFTVFGASSTPDHGQYAFTDYIPDLPFVDEKDFVVALNEVIKRYKIDFVMPAHDSVVLKLAEHREAIKATVVTAPLETCRLARSKRATYDRLQDTIKVPRLYQPDDTLPFPVFLKPDVGQGSKGTARAETAQEVTSALARDPSLLILEFLPGQEYTVDCFTDKDGQLLFVGPRSRDRIANGISVSSQTVTDPAIEEMAQKINAAVRFNGVWFFQVKKDGNGIYTLLEIAPRVAGTMALTRMRGVNLPLLSLYNASGQTVTVLPNHFGLAVDRALHSKFKLDITYNRVYVDLDDTLIVDGQVNAELMRFIYESINAGKHIGLVTKHIHDVPTTLANHKISANLFDETVSLAQDEDKHPHLQPDSIFIDDSFAERRQVLEQIGVPVFDVSEAVELL